MLSRVNVKWNTLKNGKTKIAFSFITSTVQVLELFCNKQLSSILLFTDLVKLYFVISVFKQTILVWLLEIEIRIGVWPLPIYVMVLTILIS